MREVMRWNALLLTLVLPLIFISYDAKSAKPSACDTALASINSKFDPQLFKKLLSELNERKSITEEDIKACMGRPEKLLAIIEVLATKEATKGFGFSEHIQTMSEKELKKLHKLIIENTKYGSISEIGMKKFLAELYRITHKPQGFWSFLKKSLDQIDDQVIHERIELELFTKGMMAAFKVVIREGTLSERYARVKKDTGDGVKGRYAGADVVIIDASQKFFDELKIVYPWFETTMLIALWIGSQDTLPAILPFLDQFRKVRVSDEVLNDIRKKGLETAFEIHKNDLKRPLKRGRYWRFTLATYYITFGMITAYTAAAIQQEALALKLNRLDKIIIQGRKTINESNATLRLIQNMTPEEQAKVEFNRYIAFLKKQGVIVDPDSPDMQEDLRQRITLAKENAEKAKKK